MIAFALAFLSSSAIIVPGTCSVTYNDAHWDFRALAEAMPLIKNTTSDGYTFIVKLCGSLTKEEVGFDIEYGTSALRCKGTHCDEIVYLSDFTYKPELPHNLTDGLIYTADGNLQKEESGTGYHQFRIIHNFHCDPSATTLNPKYNLVYEDFMGMSTLTFEYISSFGCPETVQYPAPTPGINPDCTFISRIEQSNLSGISMDLTTLNNGYFGLRHTILIDTDPYVLYYNPCGRSDCPIGCTCVGDTQSSAWVCKFSGTNVGNCYSYGLQGESADIKVDGTESKGVIVSYDHPTESRALKVDYKCDTSIPSGYVVPGLVATKSGEIITLPVSNFDVCVRDIPIPQPSSELCHYTKTVQGYTIDANLTKFNKQNGYSQVVKVGAGLSTWNRTLLYQPCGVVGCPNLYFCDGDEDADVWLCDEPSLTCTGYGLFKYKPTISLNNQYIMRGLKASYPADLGRSATAVWNCDSTMAAGSVRFDNIISLTGRSLSFDVYSSESCATGVGPTPSPPAVVRPVKPKMGKTPTPTPFPSVNPVLFFHNDTHFLYTNLQKFSSQKAEISDQLFASRGKTGPAYSVFSPWAAVACPSSYSCNFDVSNLWTCWVDENNSKYCHQSGYAPYNISMVPLQTDSLDEGYMISYEGAYGAGADIRVTCTRGVNVNNLVDLDQYVTFHWGTKGFEFEYSTESDVACPRKFDSTVIPNSTPSPTPNPKQENQWVYTVDDGNDTIMLDLENMPNVNETVYIGYGDHFEKNIIYYSPSKQIACPTGFNCNGMGVANIWKCFTSDTGENKCFPIGDARYNLTIGLVEDDGLDGGIEARYQGGLGGYQTSIVFQCNRSVPFGSVEFDETGTKTPANVVIVFAHTQFVCPKPMDLGRFVTGGAIFLALTLGGLSLYISCGSLFGFAKSGEVAMPNKGFWSQFFEDVKAGSIFLATCGKRSATAGSYDAI